MMYLSISPPARRSARAWVWFFAVLLTLTVAATAIQIWFNAQQQLTWQQLAAAQELWKKSGPGAYDLEYTLKKVDSTDSYTSKVRNRQVIAATLNGQPLEQRLLHYQDIPHLLGYIEEFWRQDHPEGQSAPRVFVTAVFDSHDGHLLHYIRSIMSTHERVEITVQLQPVQAHQAETISPTP